MGMADDPWDARPMNDYERIAAAIRYIQAHRTEQPNLATVASSIGLSPSRFHRLYSAWASTTPKDLIQCLTLSHAKELLYQGKSVADAALGAGHFGPGGLHDPCVMIEAATPGQIKSRGAGMEVRAGVAATPFGNCLIGESPRGICHISFYDNGQREIAIKDMHAEWPLASFLWSDGQAESLCGKIFSLPGSSSTPWKLFVRGTPFQIKVWRALLRIPSGALASYSMIAAAAGHPKASRATGSAIGSNAISFLIPCHRVIRKTGVTGHYRWGAERKRAMLAWESAFCKQD